MKIERVSVIAKMDNGDLRHVILSGDAEQLVIGLLPGFYEDKIIRISPTTLWGIEFQPPLTEQQAMGKSPAIGGK